MTKSDPKKRISKFAREDGPKQATRTGYEIPIPKTKTFFTDLRKTSTKKPS